MFYKSTKIVVTGSNVKRKAGPRVGSLGFILFSDNGQRTNHLPGCIVFSTTILFTRYGFEKKTRFESTSCLIVVPEPTPKSNVRKAFNRSIRLIKKSKLKTLILVSPVEEVIDSEDDFAAKVLTKLNSGPFTQATHILEQYPFGSRANDNNNKHYWNLDRLSESRPEHVFEFSVLWQRQRRLSDIRNLIISRYYGKPNRTVELFQFIHMCEILSEKVSTIMNGSPFKKKYYGHDKKQWIARMYKLNEYKTLVQNMYTKEKLPLTNYISSLTTEIDRRGSSILNKHK